MIPGDHATAFIPCASLETSTSFFMPPISSQMFSLTGCNSVPLAHGLTLAGSRYMTLQADITHVFGKKAWRVGCVGTLSSSRVSLGGRGSHRRKNQADGQSSPPSDKSSTLCPIHPRCRLSCAYLTLRRQTSGLVVRLFSSLCRCDACCEAQSLHLLASDANILPPDTTSTPRPIIST
jgi:hypothetical protein